MTLRLASISLFLATCIFATRAFAKAVVLEWTPMKGAVSYELRIINGGKVVHTEKLSDPKWKGDFDPGVYSYQLRSVDKLKRPGNWSIEKALVVTPKPPEATAPGESGNVTLYDDKANAPLKWKAAPGVDSYRVTVKNGDHVVYESEIQGTHADVPALPPGKYTMQVAGVVKAKGRAPAAVQGKSWETKASEPIEFIVQHKLLAVPIPIAPIGTVPPPSSRRVEFRWNRVEGAEAYELSVTEEVNRKRTPASEAVRVFTTKENKLIVTIPNNGKVHWRVRALANYTAQSTPGAAGPQSIAEADLNPNATYLDGSGYFALSTMLAPYSYNFLNQAAPTSALNNKGSLSSTQTTLRLSGEYFYRPEWGVGAAYETTSFSADSASFNRSGAEITLKYRMKLWGDRNGWFFAPKVGFETRDYVQLFRDSGGTPTPNKFSALGPSIGFDLRKQMSDRFSLGMKVSYFKPLALSGDVQYSALTGDQSNRNLSIGLQALYWLDRHWGLGAGGFIDNRSISYTPSNPTTSTTQSDFVSADSVNFFASVIYSFGR